MELYKEYDYEMNEIKKLQEKMTDLTGKIQKLTQQKTENEMVQTEMKFLDKTDKVYKLVGPLLKEEELSDAVQNVDQRLAYINKELKTSEEGLKAAERNIVDKKKKMQYIQERLVNLQKSMQEGKKE